MKQTQNNRTIKSFLKGLIIILIILQSPIGSLDTKAQIAPLSDQYLINPFMANPAVAGTERYMPLCATTKQQWIGLNRAPSTKSISLHRRIRASNIRFTPRGFINKGKNSFGKVGVGGSVFNYSYGAINHTGLSLTYAYHAFVGKGRLAFGLSPVLFQYSLNKTGFILPDRGLDSSGRLIRSLIHRIERLSPVTEPPIILHIRFYRNSAFLRWRQETLVTHLGL